MRQELLFAGEVPNYIPMNTKPPFFNIFYLSHQQKLWMYSLLGILIWELVNVSMHCIIVMEII